MRGRHYFEVTVRSDGLVRVGWSTRAAALDLGTDKQGFGFGGTGKKAHAKAFDAYGEPFGAGDVIGCALDCSAGGSGVSFSKNGKPMGAAFALPPALVGAALFPAVCLKGAEVAVNLGATPFAAQPPDGHTVRARVPARRLHHRLTGRRRRMRLRAGHRQGSGRRGVRAHAFDSCAGAPLTSSCPPRRR